MARDAYDSCLAYLDEQLGLLFDELERRGLLDDTLVVITSDHGEGLGEHELFDHGESLYSTEIDVPLLFLLPRQAGPRGLSRKSSVFATCRRPLSISPARGWIAVSRALNGQSVARFQPGSGNHQSGDFRTVRPGPRAPITVGRRLMRAR